jgi:hypothetical protein
MRKATIKEKDGTCPAFCGKPQTLEEGLDGNAIILQAKTDLLLCRHHTNCEF